MTSFKPLWTAKAADHRQDAAASGALTLDAGASAPVGFEPLWLGGGTRDFVLTQLKVGRSAVKNTEPGEGRDAQWQSQAPAQESAPLSAAPEDPNVNELSPVAAQNASPVPQDDPQAAPVAFVPAPPAVPMITCEEHVRLLEIERAAGVEAGRLEGRAEAAGIIESERQKMRAYIASIEAGFGNSAEFFAPLKKLALHIAQQLVRSELRSSGEVVSRLIENCLAKTGDRKPVVIRLHPQDIDMFKKLRGEGGGGLPLAEEASFAPGSVRVEFDDGWIEDMMQVRVDEIAQALHAGTVCGTHPLAEKA